MRKYWFNSRLLQESDGPYAWRSAVSLGDTNDRSCQAQDPELSRKLDDRCVFHGGPKWRECLPPELLAQPGLQTMILEAAAAQECIAFRLPKHGALAGGVLCHAINVIDGLYHRNFPMIFKIGYTHDAVWRWGNSLYGYNSPKEKWSNMVVFYITSEPYGPAMLEAALIEKYQSALLANDCVNFQKTSIVKHGRHVAI